MAFDVEKMRQAEDAPVPYRDRSVTLLLVTAAGRVTQANGLADKRRMITEATDGDLLLAGWPGRYHQDFFVINDRATALKELG